MLLGWIVAVAVVAAPNDGVSQNRVNGSYKVKVAGHYRGGAGGGDHVVVSGNQVRVSVGVRDESGAGGRLEGTFALSNGRFHGEGSLGGKKTSFQGRVDPADRRQGQVVKAARVVCTFRVADGHHGRLAGSRHSADETTASSAPAQRRPGRERK